MKLKTGMPFAAVLPLLFLVACSYMKADERERTTSFLAHGGEMKKMPERYPFQRVWVTETLAGNNRRHYSKVYVAPVDMTHLDTETGKLRARDVAAHPDDVKEIADYMRARFILAIKERKGSVVTVIDQDDGRPDTVILELAIVELVPTGTLRKAVGTAAGFVVPGGGALSARGAGSIAIEGRVRDAASKEVIGEFADREMDKSAPIDLAGLKWYSRSKENIDDWAL